MLHFFMMFILPFKKFFDVKKHLFSFLYNLILLTYRVIYLHIMCKRRAQNGHRAMIV